jgi:hypothetical protein
MLQHMKRWLPRRPSNQGFLWRPSLIHWLKKDSALTKCIRWSLQVYLKQRLRFQYADMTIHTSQSAMLALLNSLVQQTRLSVVDTNVNVIKDNTMGRGAARLLSSPNAGGSSIYSEALSVELLSRLLGVNLFKTEKELVYQYPEEDDNGGSGPILDYACHYMTSSHQLLTLGVSVTRAMAYHRNYTRQDANKLVNRKLKNMIKSSQGIVNTKFDRHILHVWTESGKNAALIRRVCRKLQMHEHYRNTIVLISTVNTDLVFFNANNTYHRTKSILRDT